MAHETRDIHAIEDDTHNVIEGMAGHAAQNGYVVGFEGLGYGVAMFWRIVSIC
jgi:hypothetical protein